jgi:hypothetical protein
MAAGVAVALSRVGSSSRALERATAARLAFVGGDVPAAVEAYAPLVRFHPDERFFPTSPDEFLSHSELVFFRAGARDLVVEAPDAPPLGRGGYRSAGFTTHDLTAPYHNREPGNDLGSDEGFALDLDDSSRCGGGVDAIGCTFGEAPVYYQYVPRRYVTYWFFYAYSAPVGFSGKPSYRFGHEGDWERVAVLLDDDELPTAAAYYQHNVPPHVVPWSAASADAAGSRRLIIYAALGTHASYPHTGTKNVQLGYVGVPSSRAMPSATFRDSRAAGAEWRTWLDLRGVDAAWFGFGGAWGNRGRFPFTTGPLGPSRWKAPAPCTARIGPPCTVMTAPNARLPFVSA